LMNKVEITIKEVVERSESWFCQRRLNAEARFGMFAD
jgi:hypothetical protein